MRNDTNLFAEEDASADAQVRTENRAASRGRIDDPDVAAAMVAFARRQIRLRTGAGGRNRATAAPQMILRLLE
jgi:flagellin-like hook-associated protein FlgL